MYWKWILFRLLFFFVVCFMQCFAAFSLLSAQTGNVSPETRKDASQDNENTIDIDKALEVENIWFNEDTVSIASRQETAINKAPGVVSVITGEEIKNMGFRTFADILRIIPGFEILKNGSLGDTFPTVRGLSAANRVRVMIDGHLVNNPLRGDAFVNFDGYPVDNIKKIEIIRGPGSALYGENAFLSVINIVTRSAEDINGAILNSGYGSYDTVSGNVVFGQKLDKFEISGMVNYTDSNGYDGTVTSDSQTVVDNELSSLGYSPSSLAPGSVDDWWREYDMDLLLKYDDVYLRGFYSNKNRGPFIGQQYALNDDTNIENNYVFCEIGYEKKFGEKGVFKPKAYYDQFDRNAHFDSLPEGTSVYTDPDEDGIYNTLETYTDGYEIDSKVIERIAGAEIPVTYELFDGNMFTLGMEYRWLGQDNIHHISNVHPVTLEYVGFMQNYSDSYPQIDEAKRNIWSAYIQDSWDITDTINITLGVRYDHYDDFGSTVNPRTGITWQFLKSTSLKILYGEAFRPPDFAAMYANPEHPVIHGNENLDPEEIKTYEIGIQHTFNKYVSSAVNYFYNDIEDLISLRSVMEGTDRIQTYDNYGNAHVHGVEFETRVDIFRGNYVFMNYTFQDAQDDNGKNLPFSAKHKGNIGFNAQPWKYLNVNASTFVSGKRYREDGDSRDDMPSFSLVNLSLISKEFFKTMEIQGTVYNLLDKDYDDPGPITVEDDLPRPGRTYFIGVSYTF
ncbi:MAG: TonB-dependent receptor [Planctomycetes bacterium]|nr:TonB-dependent receptor [Planctomycetota bacterium]